MMLLMNIIFNIAVCADGTALYSNFDQATDLWQQLKLTSELESDLQDTVDWGMEWFFNFKTQLVLFFRSNNTGAIDMKMGGVCSRGKIFF